MVEKFLSLRQMNNKKGKNMKKIFTLGLMLTTVTTAANAGLLEKFGLVKSEPKTLEEACDKSEITAVCPDMILGSQTMVGCLSENVSNLSKKCAKFVTKKVAENKDQVVETVTNTTENVKTKVSETKVQQKAASAEKKAELKKQKAEMKEKKAELKKAVAETKAAAKQTGESLKETGNVVF